jgi:hypothetical protein
LSHIPRSSGNSNCRQAGILIVADQAPIQGFIP